MRTATFIWKIGLPLLAILAGVWTVWSNLFPEMSAQPNWSYAVGQWVEESGALQQKDSSTRALALRPDQLSRYSARVKVRFSRDQTGAAAGLVAQAIDPNNYYTFGLERKKSGTYAVLKVTRDKKVTYISHEMVGDQAPVEVDPSDWQELHLEVEGPHLAGYLQERLVVSFSFLGAPPKWYAHGPLWEPDLERGRVGLFTHQTEADFTDFRIGERSQVPIFTPHRPRLDYRGGVLPRQSYSETISDWTRWFADSPQYTDYRDAPQASRTWPPYILSSFVFSDDVLGTDIQYPGHNHPPIIEGFVKQHFFESNPAYLRLARELADWNLEHSTPSTWTLPHLALSHFDFRKHLDSLEPLGDSGFEPDKSAYQGLAYLLLHTATGERKYLEAAVRMAETLRGLQRADGGFPFRVRPKDGLVLAPYTASAMWYVRFFEDLADFTGNEAYREVRNRTFRWLMNNPVQTNNWRGFYGDIATETESYDQWTALDTAMYLLERRHEQPDYLKTALGIVKWVEDKLMVKDGFYPGVPALLEQTSYATILSMHTNRLAEVYARLWGALGEPRYKDLAEQIANTVTWLAMSDGKMRIGLWWHAQGTATSGIIFTDQYLRIMSEIPETAPQAENHFLYHSSYVKEVNYSDKSVRLRTQAGGEARFSLKDSPLAVRDEKGMLPQVRQLDQQRSGWIYDPQRHFLRVRHQGQSVTIDLQK